MTYTTAFFFFFAAILVFAGLRVITARNPVHAVLYLVLAFFTAAGLWMLLEAEFLAITLVLVYVGAVMVLFLFVVLLFVFFLVFLCVGFWVFLLLVGFVAVLLVIEMALILGSRHFGLEVMGAPAPHAADYSNTKELGRVLYTEYVYAFELAAVILLVAIVAAIALTLRRRKDSKYIDPAEQVKVRRNDRLRIVRMEAGKSQATQKPGAGEGGA